MWIVTCLAACTEACMWIVTCLAACILYRCLSLPTCRSFTDTTRQSPYIFPKASTHTKANHTCYCIRVINTRILQVTRREYKGVAVRSGDKKNVTTMDNGVLI